MRLMLLAFLFGSSIASQAEPVAPMLAADADRQWVPFELTPGNQLRFRMMVNGRPASAVLDTGVSYTVASTAFASTAGLRPSASGSADAVGGRVAVRWAAIERLQLGGLTRTGGRVAVTDLGGIATRDGDPIDLLIGADVLQHAALDIDHDARRFRLIASGRLPFRGQSAPLSLARDTGVYLSEVTLGMRRIRPVIVDTGDGAALTLSAVAWRSTRLASARPTTGLAYGLGGPVVSEIAVAPQLRLGTLTARNVEVRIEPGPSFAGETGTAGRIGSGLLGGYRVLLDPRAGRMVLARGRSANQPPVKSTSGLLITRDGEALRVVHVMRHSPAAADDWRAGDRICRVDGERIDRSPAPGSWTTGTPGRTVALELCDGGTRALTLASFY